VNNKQRCDLIYPRWCRYDVWYRSSFVRKVLLSALE